MTPTTAASVPLCFGFHPYLTIPDVPRAEWKLETPPLRHLPVDNWGIPTGDDRGLAGHVETLGDKIFDDGFDEVPQGAVFALSGGDRRIEVIFEQGYPAAQIFAPANDDVVGIEPMAAPTNALRKGGYSVAVPGRPRVHFHHQGQLRGEPTQMSPHARRVGDISSLLADQRRGFQTTTAVLLGTSARSRRGLERRSVRPPSRRSGTAMPPPGWSAR